MKEIRGKTALVTGASRGIGPHIVRALAEEGMNLVLSARTVGALERSAQLARSLGVGVTRLAADLGRRSDVESLAERAQAESGGIDVLVNNAGIDQALRYENVEPDMIERMVAVDLTAPLLLTRLLLPAMIRRGEGHIVNIASLAGLVGTPYESVYSAVKHGLVGFSRSLTLELRAEGHRVGVSVICPGFVSGAGMYEDTTTAEGSKESRAPAMVGTVPVEKVARAVARAIRRNEPEVVISGMPVLPMLLTQALSPRVAARMSAAIGVPSTFKRWADAAQNARR